MKKDLFQTLHTALTEAGEASLDALYKIKTIATTRKILCSLIFTYTALINFAQDQAKLSLQQKQAKKKAIKLFDMNGNKTPPESQYDQKLNCCSHLSQSAMVYRVYS